jgi:hypothetical protein
LTPSTAYGPGQSSATEKIQLVNRLKQVMLKDVRVIPIPEEIIWYEYNTVGFCGWVTPGSPYAQRAAVGHPDAARVLPQLRPSEIAVQSGTAAEVR